MRLAWATDIHFNFVDGDGRRRFLRNIAERADALAVSGDIGESDNVESYLREMHRFLRRPVYVVLGNHDFYRGTIAGTRMAVTRLAEQSEHLVYLSASGVVELSSDTALIGHDGWGDARFGDFESSDVILTDYVLIAELRRHTKNFVFNGPDLMRALHRLGDEAAAHLDRTLREAVRAYPNILAVTHVPPFREAAWYEGRFSDDNWAPHFSCKATGDVFLEVMRAHPECNLTVMCGHTHGGGEYRPLPNVHVLTGKAKYGAPRIQQVFEID